MIPDATADAHGYPEPVPTEWNAGPSATVLVDHVLDSSTNGRFFFRPDRFRDVTVRESGDLELDWDPWPGGSALLLFRLDQVPEGVRLDGFSLGWSGSSFPSVEPRELRFSARARTVPGAGGSTHELEVSIDRSQMEDAGEPVVLTYHLTVAYPDGSSHVVDPKICNKGDGLGDGCA